MCDSRSTWNFQYSVQSNLQDAKLNVTTTFLFDSRSTWNIWIHGGWAQKSIQYIARSNLWDAKHNGTTTFMFDSRNTKNI